MSGLLTGRMLGAVTSESQKMHRPRTVLALATLVLAPVLLGASPSAGTADVPPVGASCDPEAEPNCMPTRDECEAGGHDGVYLPEEGVLPATVCAQGVAYATGDPVELCGTIIVADQVLVDETGGDPEKCFPHRREWGYVNARSGNQLRWTALLPEGEGPFPVALELTTYQQGTNPGIGEVGGALLDAGYALAVANITGTGCSSGLYDMFRPYEDLYDTVEWIADQPWSTGDVGLYGLSASGISQIYAASTQPPSLRAIAPNSFPVEVYREFLYPGGIMNVGYGNTWIAFQSAIAAQEMPDAAQDGDTQCFGSQTSGGPTDPTRSLGRTTGILDHPYWDDWYDERVALTHVPKVEVPVLACQTWQDEQNLVTTSWLDLFDPDQVWSVFTNGYHGACDWGPPLQALTVRFFDAFVDSRKDVDFSDVPRVQLWHESTNFVATEPSWVTTHDAWPIVTEERVLHLGDGTLDAGPGADAGSVSYPYPLPSASAESSNSADAQLLWQLPPVPQGWVAWTTQPLAEDLELFGAHSLDLWLSSTAPSTDLQVTLTEVRPDGQEMYLRRGWLRASHRALDPERSTATRPVHTHLESDLAPLPDEPTLVRVEIPDINHVFRAGSAIRVIVDAPTGRTGFWQLGFDPTPAVNTIHHGPDFPSRLVLSVIPGGRAPEDRPLPDCGTVLYTPCRPDPLG